MRQRQLHLTGKYHKCLSASLLQTSQSKYVEYESNKSRLLKEAVRFYNNLLVSKPLTDVVPSPLLQNISEITWHLPSLPASHPHYHSTPSPNLEKLRRRPTYCLSLWQAICWSPHRYCHLESADEEHRDHRWVNVWMRLQEQIPFGSCPAQCMLSIITPCNDLLVWIATPGAAQILQSCMPEKRHCYHVAAYHTLICDLDIYSK